MEEKLYFEPANYGSDKKTKKRKHEPRESSSKAKVFGTLLFLGFICIIFVILFFFLRGKETTSGRFPDNLKNESLECIAKDVTYEKTNRLTPQTSEMKITIIFYGENDFNSINSKYIMNFASRKEATEAEAIGHVQFAENLGYSDLSFEEFDNKFSIIDNSLILALYSGKSFSRESEYEYFMLKKNSKTDSFPSSLKEYRKNYEDQGFSCKSSIDNK